MTRRILFSCVLVLLALAMVPAVGAQTVPIRVVQASTGTLYLAQGGNAWMLMPSPMSDDDLAALTMIGALDSGLIVGQSPPLRLVQGSDGTLYLIQTGTAWTWSVQPAQIADDELATLTLGNEIDGDVPAELLSTTAPDRPADTPTPTQTPTPDVGIAPATATPTLETSTQQIEPATATPEPPATSTRTPAPTATRTLTPTRASTPTPVPTYTLSGTVTRDTKSVANVRVSVLELSLETTTGADGGFSFAGLQNSSYSLVAEDTDLTSIPRKLATIDSQVPVTIEMVKPLGGPPLLFAGQVTGGDVAGVTVRSVGGAGQGITDGNGNFVLVDAHVISKQIALGQEDVVLVAFKGNRWGFAIGPFTNSLTIQLNRTGTAPVAATKPLMTRADLVNGATINQGVDVILTARWMGAPTEAVAIVPQTNGFTPLDCRGSCSGHAADGFAVFLQKGTAYTLALTVPNSATAIASPKWLDPQVLPVPSR
jgi:hypothetical protein